VARIVALSLVHGSFSPPAATCVFFSFVLSFWHRLLFQRTIMDIMGPSFRLLRLQARRAGLFMFARYSTIR
jgi:hypothetical protein